jgi:flagellar hook-associated protein 2
MMSMRISGLASGMDIDTIVKQLMTAERAPLDKMYQKKQILEWQRDDYRSMNTLLLDFRTTLTNMKMASNYRARTTTSSNDTFVSATATSASSLSSNTISKVTQLATSERVLNSTTLSFISSSSLYEQTSSSPDIQWNKGSVETKTIVADGTKATYSLNTDLGLDLSNLKKVGTEYEVGSWSVKVNGKGYQVVDKATFDNAVASDNVVYIDSTTGSIQFKENISKDSSIRLDYIANNRTEKLNLSYNTSTLQLSKGSINELYNASTKQSGTAQQIKLTRTVKKGETETPQADVYFDVGADGKITYKDSTDIITELGTFDKATGKITFSESGQTYLKNNNFLPPEKPESGKTYSYNLELTYDQNYTSFSASSITSKGNMYENFIVQGTETINSISSKLSNSSVGLSLFYDETTGKMSLTRTETGKFNTDQNQFDFSASGSLINAVFGFSFSDPTPSNVNVSLGKNAEFVINGISTTRSSNTFTVSGITYTLKQTFGETGTANPTASPVTLNVNNDGSKVFDNIVQFVNKYNELIDKIQAKTGEERYRTYTPLTDEQREEMSDKQQELWDEKAKSGLLRSDSILTSALSNMRMDFYQSVDNEQVSTLYNQLSELGITTGANYLNGGKLTIDETKLKEAIEKDPESVENFFKGTGTTEAQTGVINRLYDTVTNAMDQLKQKAGNSYSTNQTFVIGKELDTLEDRIDLFEDRLTQIEDRYYSQFTAMEQAIQRANEQSAYLTNMFAS